MNEIIESLNSMLTEKNDKPANEGLLKKINDKLDKDIQENYKHVKEYADNAAAYYHDEKGIKFSNDPEVLKHLKRQLDYDGTYENYKIQKIDTSNGPVYAVSENEGLCFIEYGQITRDGTIKLKDAHHFHYKKKD